MKILFSLEIYLDELTNVAIAKMNGKTYTVEKDGFDITEKHDTRETVEFGIKKISPAQDGRIFLTAGMTLVPRRDGK